MPRLTLLCDVRRDLMCPTADYPVTVTAEASVGEE